MRSTTTKAISSHQCPQCPYSTPWTFALVNHLKRHPIKIPFDSFDCSKDLKVYCCSVCLFASPSQVLLVQHQISDHPSSVDLGNPKNFHMEGTIKQEAFCGQVETEYTCRCCGLLTFSKVFLFMHVEKCNFVAGGSSSTSEWFECYTSKARNVSSDAINWLQCSECSFKTKYPYNLKKHRIRRHVPNTNLKWLECTQCSFKSKFKDDLRMHRTRTHSHKMKLLRCTECSYKTINNGALKRHQNSEHVAVENSKWLECNYCSYKAKLKGNLKRHQVNMHQTKDKIIWLKCAQCSFKTKSKDSLRKHQIRKHVLTDETAWLECEECSFTTKCKDYLRMHKVRKHSDKMKSLQCTECSYKTIYNSTLKRHQARKHADTKNEIK